jgi:hypothetical protein
MCQQEGEGELQSTMQLGTRKAATRLRGRCYGGVCMMWVHTMGPMASSGIRATLVGHMLMFSFMTWL